MSTEAPSGILERISNVRCAIGSGAVTGFFNGLSRVGRLSPRADPSKYGVMVVRDVPYLPDGHLRHRLDIYVPRRLPSPRPALLYLHGGGFSILSKETHWAMALAFARQGFVVFNADYRLAPEYPFPAAIQDACAAYRWVIANARRWGGDLGRLVVAGESAGANLTAAVTIATCFERSEPYAQAVFDTGVVPRAALPACGLLQTSAPERFLRNEALMPFIADRILAVSEGYLPDTGGDPERFALADPLVILEGDAKPARPLPAFQVIVGERDPIVDDSIRLGAALTARNATVEVRTYAKQGHAFHAYMWRREAKQAWRDTFGFLDRNLS